MKQYRPTAMQAALLQLPFETSTLCLLEKQPVSRIQIVSLKGDFALKSIDDIPRKIRIIIASVLTKILLEHSQRNEERLETLKKIIYSAKLSQITQKKGIVREHLLKSVAQKLSRLSVSSDAEIEVLKMLNLTPFFDEVVLDALKEENPLMFQSDCQLITWLDRELDYKIIITEDSLGMESESELFLLGIGEKFHPTKDCKCIECTCKEYRQFLRLSTTQSLDSPYQQSVEGIYDRKTRGEMFSRLIFQEEQIEKSSNEVNPNLYASVLSSSIDLATSQGNLLSLRTPPNLKEVKRTELEESFNSASFSKNKKTIREQRTDSEMEPEAEKSQKVMKVKRKKTNSQQSGLWSFLCCKF